MPAMRFIGFRLHAACRHEPRAEMMQAWADHFDRLRKQGEQQSVNNNQMPAGSARAA
jgi:hypothetical protein